MLIEIWERLRGYDKWIETQATAESSSVEKTPIKSRYGETVGYEYASGDVITWIDRQGEKQYADFTVPDDSPLYQMVGGETVTIRYDPASPDRFYYRDLLRTKVHTTVRITLITLVFLIVVVGRIYFRVVSRMR
jgi:Protein of unknown function (DUF3592)